MGREGAVDKKVLTMGSEVVVRLLVVERRKSCRQEGRSSDARATNGSQVMGVWRSTSSPGRRFSVPGRFGRLERAGMANGWRVGLMICTKQIPLVLAG